MNQMYTIVLMLVLVGFVLTAQTANGEDVRMTPTSTCSEEEELIVYGRQIACTASKVKPPTKTERQRNNCCSPLPGSLLHSADEVSSSEIKHLLSSNHPCCELLYVRIAKSI